MKRYRINALNVFRILGWKSVWAIIVLTYYTGWPKCSTFGNIYKYQLPKFQLSTLKSQEGGAQMTL